MKYHRHSKKVRDTKRWKQVRFVAKKRAGFRCVICGARDRLEVDHIKPVRTHPELAYVFSNLQALCRPCHSRKTAIEIGLTPLSPERTAWRELLKEDISNA